jgi:hypothetical protein
MQERDEEVVFMGYTRKELKRAFEEVQNRENWKLPIDTVMIASVNPTDDVPVISKVTAAVQFYTASTPTFVREGAHWRVRAAGYYEAVGA